MPRGRPRKARVTKKEVIELREKQKKEKAVSTYKRKKNIIPGPWTNIDSEVEVKVKLKENSGVNGTPSFGSYPNTRFYPIIDPRGWYPILINITSKSIKRDVEEHGLDNYVAACEKSLNEQKKYGSVVILQVSVDHSLDEERGRRFLSCLAKTNKKNISGFAAIRKKLYVVIE